MTSRSTCVRIACALVLVSTACSDGDDSVLSGTTPVDAAWVATAAATMQEAIPDPLDDHDPSEPPYTEPVDYPPTDVTSLDFGADADYLYLHITYAGTIPHGPLSIPASGEVEAQTVVEQSFSFVLDTDNDDFTGAGASNFVGDGGMQGVDIFFGISFRYGSPIDVYANYDFAGGDIHQHGGQIIGELGSGGPGHDYMIVRYPIDSLDRFFWPVGTTVEAGGWSEAESTLYHEFSNDFLVPQSWTIPGG